MALWVHGLGGSSCLQVKHSWGTCMRRGQSSILLKVHSNTHVFRTFLQIFQNTYFHRHIWIEL